MSASFSVKSFVAAIRNLAGLSKSPEEEPKQLIELLRYIAESLVWSEQHNETLFQYFVVEDTLKSLSFVLERASSKPIIIQLIQTANILLHNLAQPEHKVYLLSSEFYSNVVAHPFDFADEEIIENYISLLKGLATNTSSDKLISFIIDNNFALYARSLMFINYNDNLIKTAARTVILTILKCNSYKVHDYTINDYIIESGLVFNLVDMLKKQIYSIDKVIKSGKWETRIDTSLNELVDSIYYINDMLEQVDPLFTDKLSNCFLQVFVPVLVGSINSEVHSSYHVAIHVAYYVLIQIFNIFKHTSIVDALASCLLSKSVSALLLDICMCGPPASPPDFIDFSVFASTENPIRASMFSFLKCKDDNLVCLSLLLLQGVLINTGVSRSLRETLFLEDDGNPASLEPELTNALLAVYSTYPLFRFTIYKIISKIIFELTCNLWPSSLSTYILKVREFCCTNISKLEKLLVSKDHSDAILDFFDEEWDSVLKIDFAAKVPVFNHNILPDNSEDPRVVLDHKKPTNDLELCRTLVKLFFLMRKLIFCMNGDDPNVYPFVYASKINEWQCGNAYSTQGIQFVRVFVEGDEAPVKYMAEDEDFFVLVEADVNRMEYGTVKVLEKWRSLVLKVDEKRQLLVIALKNQKNIVLNFTEPCDYFQMVERLSFKISTSRSYEMSMVESFLLDSCNSFLYRYD